VKDVFAHGEKMQLAKQKILNSLGIAQTFSGAGKLDGPYAPLKRFGKYIGQLKSKELRAAEDAKDKKLISKLKADPDHYVMSMFDTMGQAKQFA
ncbi:hypothetical protein H9X75_09875, partial [Fusobacterium mortiferum]|uniref:hypothetical protein n=1 Tax=Fusobacterium mortiferum TaxID=850 RepID=UPI001957EA09|nr:hypothetical protein [Fusobacterium mortiferum]